MNDQPLKKNYDYGEGLYFGPMDRFKSVKEFLEYRKKKRKKKTVAQDILNMAVQFEQSANKFE